MEAAQQRQQGRVLQFKPATKQKAKLRLALVGPSGSGKTYSALAIARGLVPNGRIALIDTERGSASKYADKFQFETLELEQFEPLTYVQAIQTAERGGFDVIIIDSLSHAYDGKGGLLEQVDNIAARSRSGNSFSAWKDATPMQNRLVDAILGCRAHVIVTMRVKTEWVLEDNDKGKKVPRKVGLQPVQRHGIEYEFDVVGDLHESRLVITKSRCSSIAKAVIDEPGVELGKTLREWLTDGSEAPASAQPEPAMKEEAPVEHDFGFDENEPAAASKPRPQPPPAQRPSPQQAQSTPKHSSKNESTLSQRRRRAWLVWEQRKACGVTPDEFWIEATSVLGHERKQPEWTDQDLEKLERWAKRLRSERQEELR